MEKNFHYKIREWQMNDKKHLAENANNIHIWNNIRDYFPYPYTEKDAEEFINFVLSKPKPTTEFTIEVAGEAAGGIGFTLNSDVERITAEIGYWLGEKYWGKGIMTNVLKEVMDYAFTNFPLVKLYAPVFDFNIGSQKVLEKAGFEREAVLKKSAVKNGKVIDMYYYSFIKSES